MMRTFFITILFYILGGCATVTPLKIESNPVKAKVYLYDQTQKKFVSIGDTPFLLDKKEEEKLLGSSSNDLVAFKIEKPGYAVEHIIYDRRSRKKLSYLLQLKEIELWSDQDAEMSSKLATDIAKKVQKINTLIVQKELADALEIIESLIAQYPKAYIFYDMKGSVHLLKGNNNLAITSLKKSLSLNPDNPDSMRVLSVLQRKQ